MTKRKQPTKATCIRLESEFEEKIAELCKELNLNKSQVIKEAIIELHSKWFWKQVAEAYRREAEARKQKAQENTSPPDATSPNPATRHLCMVPPKGNGGFATLHTFQK